MFKASPGILAVVVVGIGSLLWWFATGIVWLGLLGAFMIGYVVGAWGMLKAAEKMLTEWEGEQRASELRR